MSVPLFVSKDGAFVQMGLPEEEVDELLAQQKFYKPPEPQKPTGPVFDYYKGFKSSDLEFDHDVIRDPSYIMPSLMLANEIMGATREYDNVRAVRAELNNQILDAYQNLVQAVRTGEMRTYKPASVSEDVQIGDYVDPDPQATEEPVTPDQIVAALKRLHSLHTISSSLYAEHIVYRHMEDEAEMRRERNEEDDEDEQRQYDDLSDADRAYVDQMATRMQRDLKFEKTSEPNDDEEEEEGEEDVDDEQQDADLLADETWLAQGFTDPEPSRAHSWCQGEDCEEEEEEEADAVEVPEVGTDDADAIGFFERVNAAYLQAQNK